MNPTRPDPDEILARLKEEEVQAQRGKLKIFFGASAGVGKTYAMLLAAQAQHAQNVDLIVGLIETHGRAETQALLDGLEQLPLKTVHYRDRTLKEFDLDAALTRAPKLILIDELAHSNAPGSLHPKRWQDVEEMLKAGVDVWTTLNVQHLETLNDIVNGITGIAVRETVPDRIFDAADDVVIVDLTPDELLQRLQEGKIYLPQQAATAIQHFFRKGNLIALRELALRRTADRVDDDMLHYRRTQSVSRVWSTREGLLLCIGPDENAEKLVRSTARLASQMNVPWHCIYVETPPLQRLPQSHRERLLRILKMAQEAGAQTAIPSGNSLAPTIVKYARDHNLPRLVLGRVGNKPLRFWRRTLVQTLEALSKDLDIIQIALPAQSVANQTIHHPTQQPQPTQLTTTPLENASAPSYIAKVRPYAMSALLCLAAALMAAPLHSIFELANIVMIFLLAVVLVAVRYGRGPAVLASFLSVAAFDFLYVTPRFSFSVADVQYLATFIIMLTVALVVGQLTAVLKWQVQVATSRETRMSALYEMSRDLSGALMHEQISDVAARVMASEFEAKIVLLIADLEGQLSPVTPQTDRLPIKLDVGIAQWAFDHAETAGHGTNTLPASPVLYLPLKAPMRLRGVLAIEPRNPLRLAGPEQRRMLDTCASLLALSIERIHYVDVAQDTTVQMESERLRNSLLSAISHDLRTPLSSLIAMAETLTMTPPLSHTETTMEIAHALRDTALRISSQVNNLLDMARLQSGHIHLQKQWLPLEEAIGSALRAMTGAIDAQRVHIHLPNDLPLLHIDPMLFERVLCNLLENAAKYTPHDSPIDISAKVSDGSFYIMVDDHGPGLPQHREEAIFQKFERGHKESATSGVGLGLAICRAIIDAHGGTISGETRPEGGARFTLIFPELKIS
jgi:two-component system sensor histidine kinase KdpD